MGLKGGLRAGYTIDNGCTLRFVGQGGGRRRRKKKLNLAVERPTVLSNASGKKYDNVI